MSAPFHFILRTVPRPILIKLSYLFKAVAPVFLAGNKVECAVCGKSYGKFLPYGYSGRAKRKNVLCPNCLSLERHRLLWLYLKNDSNFFTDKLKVLHVAPEQCFYKRFKAQENLEYVTADLNSPLADVKMDLHDAPFEDNSFDVIFCNHVLEHVDDDRKCMSELFRIMKPGGMGVFQVPMDFSRDETYEDSSITDPKEREVHFWQKDHVRLYGNDYPKRLEEAGFDVETVNLVADMDEGQRLRYRLPVKEPIYVCRKK